MSDVVYEYNSCGCVLSCSILALVRSKLTPSEESNLKDIWKGWRIYSHSQQFSQFQCLLTDIAGRYAGYVKELESEGVVIKHDKLMPYFIYDGLKWIVDDELPPSEVIIESPDKKRAKITELWYFRNL